MLAPPRSPLEEIELDHYDYALFVEELVERCRVRFDAEILERFEDDVGCSIGNFVAFSADGFEAVSFGAEKVLVGAG